MNKKLLTLTLSGALLCSMGAPSLAAGKTSSPKAEGPGAGDVQPLPDSQLYYGQVKAVLTHEDGAVAGLHMDSERYGEYVMKISGQTFWIDSGERTASSPDGLEPGERLYVFHSPVSTRSMPPQSAAFAVVRNVPQDAGCAMYHKVEGVEELEGRLQITTDNGGLFLYAGEETGLASYTGSPVDGLGAIEPGAHIMAWYDAVALSYPGLANYSDAGDISLFAQPALAWAHQKGLLPAEGRLGPKDAVSLAEAEAMIAALSGAKAE